MTKIKSNPCIFIPLTIDKGIIVIPKSISKEQKKFQIIENRDEIDNINKYIVVTEKAYGNSFIFGITKELIQSYINLN